MPSKDKFGLILVVHWALAARIVKNYYEKKNTTQT
jgi:hypothetical protein